MRTGYISTGVFVKIFRERERRTQPDHLFMGESGLGLVNDSQCDSLLTLAVGIRQEGEDARLTCSLYGGLVD